MMYANVAVDDDDDDDDDEEEEEEEDDNVADDDVQDDDVDNNVLWVKIAGPVWYTIYHYLPVVKGVNKPLY